MDAHSFARYIERLQGNLEGTAGVIGLVTLGSTADAALRDEWSDHDFWVITKPGAQDGLLENLLWLPDAEDLVMLLHHGKRYRTGVYRNRHKVEFAVLDAEEAKAGKIARFQVLIDRDGVSELAAAVHRRTCDEAQASAAWPDALQSLCVTVWTACERHSRGELLSARQYLDGFAVDQLLQLLAAHAGGPGSDGADVLDGRRRLELRTPDLAAAVRRALGEPVLAAALGLLNIAETELRPLAPELAWDDVTLVQKWIRDLPTAESRSQR